MYIYNNISKQHVLTKIYGIFGAKRKKNKHLLGQEQEDGFLSYCENFKIC